MYIYIYIYVVTKFGDKGYIFKHLGNREGEIEDSKDMVLEISF